MALYLVQHGKSLPKDRDADQGLSPEGIAEVTRITEVAQGYRVPVSCIRHSGKTRARQTAEIFAAALRPPEGVEEMANLNPLDDVTPVAAGLDPAANLMLVGHLPFLARLASYLIIGRTDPRVFKFQNGGIVCLDKDPDSSGWHIKWALMPQIG